MSRPAVRSPLTGGMLTNSSTTNGEWVVLYCWNGTSDRVCDIDYASWGATSASNPKMDKTGISIDGPDAGAAPSAYNADIAAASQTNLGTAALVKPNTYQRVGGEVGEVAARRQRLPRPGRRHRVNWVPVPSPTGGTNIRFHVRFENQDDDSPSSPVNGQMFSQEFGVFLPDYGPDRLVQRAAAPALELLRRLRRDPARPAPAPAGEDLRQWRRGRRAPGCTRPRPARIRSRTSTVRPTPTGRATSTSSGPARDRAARSTSTTPTCGPAPGARLPTSTSGPATAPPRCRGRSRACARASACRSSTRTSRRRRTRCRSGGRASSS